MDRLGGGATRTDGLRTFAILVERTDEIVRNLIRRAAFDVVSLEHEHQVTIL